MGFKILTKVEQLLDKTYPQPITSTAGGPELDLHMVAEQYLELKKLSDYIEARMKALKDPLIYHEAYELFPDVSMKVAYAKGSEQTAIDVLPLWRDLFNAGRGEDFAKVVTVTATALERTLPDGAALASKYKVSTGTTSSPTIRVAAMSKDDIQKAFSK
jgi:hypothetical protein